MRNWSIVVVAAISLLVAACGGAATTAAGADSDGTTGTGIGVHGAWELSIYNPDGSLERSVDFTNALTNPRLLVELLTVSRYQTDWHALIVEGQTAVNGLWLCTDPFDTGSTTENHCAITSADGPGVASANGIFLGAEVVSQNLLVEVPLETATEQFINLSGSFTVPDTGQITGLDSVFCRYIDEDPSAGLPCQASDARLLTEKDITTLDWDNDTVPNDGPIPVTEGQTVNVEATLTFGTLP